MRFPAQARAASLAATMAVLLMAAFPLGAQSPGETLADTYYLQGARDLRAQRRVDGEWALLQALRYDPEHFRAHMELARLYLLVQPELALTHVLVAKRLRPSFDEVYLVLGQVYERQERLIEAAEQYRKAIRLNARMIEADRRLKALLRALRERKSAIEKASEQFWRRPNLASLTLYGRVVMQESSPLQALLEFESIRERLPDLPEVNLWIARTQRLLGSLEGELEAYRRYLERAPGAHHVRLALAERLLDLGRHDEAVRALDSLLPELDRTGPLVDREVQGRTAFLESRALVGRADPVRAGEMLIRAGRFGVPFEQVDGAFGAYLAQYPEVAALHIAHGQWLRGAGRFAESAQAYARAGLLAEPRRAEARTVLQELLAQSRAPNEALLGLGEFAAAEGKDAEARAMLARIPPAHPASRRAALLLTVLARRANDLPASLDYALRYILSFPDREGMAFARGNVFWESGQPDVAEAIWGDYPALFISHPEILVRLAGYYGARALEPAELATRELLRDMEPARLANRRRLGELYQTGGRIEAAVAEWEGIVRLLPADYDLRLRLARTEIGIGRPATAVEHLLDASRLRPIPREMTEWLGRELLGQRRYAEAFEIYWTLYQADAAHPEAGRALPGLALQLSVPPEAALAAARLAEGQQRLAAAVEILENAVRRYPDDGDTRVMLAGLYLQRGDAAEAEHVIAADGGDLSDMRRLRILAEAQLRQNKQEDAAGTLRQMLQLEPADMEIAGQMAFLLHDLGRHEEAIPLLSGMLARNQDDREALLRMAQSEFALGRYEPGKARLRRLLVLEPDHEGGLGLLIDRTLKERRWKEAAPLLDRWVAMHGEDATARFNLITAYLRQFNRKAARPHYDVLITLNPVQARRLSPYFR